MSEIVIFSGTTEGRIISSAFSDNKIAHTVCVATEFGKIVMDENEYATVYSNRLNEIELEAFLIEEGAKYVIDATHPYATLVTKSLQLVSDRCGIEYIRVIRQKTESDYNCFVDVATCVNALKNTTGNILLTTGSKDIEAFASEESIRNRLFVRIIPSLESLKKCEASGINSKQIIAMVGPFSRQINEAIIKQFDIKNLVTKDGGKNGGFIEKVDAAYSLGTNIFVIGREAETGYTLSEALERFGISPRKKVTLVGIGCGEQKHLTIASKAIIEEADLLLGAKRMLKPYKADRRTKELYLSDEICDYLDSIKNDIEIENIAILFSGDTGFFSGASKLFDRLKDRKDIDLDIECGISSFSYFSSRIHEDYSDAKLISLHGKALNSREKANFINMISENEKCFVILSGVLDVVFIGEALSNIGSVELMLGYNLSYENEKIIKLTPDECKNITEEGLYIAYIHNKTINKRPQMLLLNDEEFIRGNIPMTKAQIRHMVVQKMLLYRGAVVYDVGAGTGSVSIEMACQFSDSQIFAFERKVEAIELIEKNKEKFLLDNITVVSGDAPKSFDKINIVPTHAFIGGSNGNIIDIVKKLVELNKEIRIVATAISIENVAMLNELVKIYPDRNTELICANIAIGKRVSDYSLMEGMNPVYIFSMGGKNV